MTSSKNTIGEPGNLRTKKNQVVKDGRQEVQFDVWRVLLIEMAHLVTSLLVPAESGKSHLATEKLIDELLRNLNELGEMPGHRGVVRIEHRGFERDASGVAKNDYRILFEPLVVDHHTAAGVIQRLGARMSHLAAGLGKAFGILADFGIMRFVLNLPAPEEADQTELKLALAITAKFFRGSVDESRLHLQVNGKSFQVPVIEYPPGSPNLDLTLLAAVNSMAADDLLGLIADRITEAGIPESLSKELLDDNNFLKRPPLEIIWKEKGCDKPFGGSDRQADKSASVLAGRLQLMSGMLNVAQSRPDRDDILPMVLEKIRQELERLDPEDIDSIEIQNQGLCIRQAGRSMIVGLVNNHILDLLELVKERLDTCRKISAIQAHGFKFNHPDCSDLARDFNMAEDEVRQILNILGDCYDSEGRFLRNEFENRIDEFVRYEKRIFEFLWGFLKQTEDRVDRLGFLNALQKVIIKLNRPKRFLRFLLADVCSNPGKVEYADRNALMLINVLLRTYNKELDIDIELTPEEVLLVRNGIDKDVVKYAKWRIESDSKRIMSKMATIHDSIERQLLKSQQPPTHPLHFLLALEREFIIFFALVSGTVATKVISDVAEYYGNPFNPIYQSGHGIQYISDMMQQLKIAVRGLGRVGSVSELKILDLLLQNISEFGRLHDSAGNNAEVKNTLVWIERSIAEIRRRQDLE